MSPGDGREAASAFTFGKYRVLEELGRGGMGVVYRARQEDLDRTVALKLILASHLASPEQVGRFHAEAQAAAKARHPGVVGVYETGTHDGQHYMAMEYIDGAALDEWMAEHRYDSMEAARLLAAIARAVAYLHSLGIVHRDLKPSNILLDRAGNPHVTDFGLAKVRDETSGLSVSGAVIGTPGYMAPEQVAGAADELGPWSDVYGLGAILYECCAGQHPFHADTPVAVLMRVLHGEPQRPRSIASDMPRELETVCLKCLEKAPRDRYQSADAVADDLERVLAGEPIEAGNPSLLQRLRHSVRRRPALAARLFAFAVFFGVTLTNDAAGRIPEAAFVSRIALVLSAWTVISLVLHRMLTRDIATTAVRYVWATADAALFTVVMWLGDGARSPMLTIYPLLIAAAGLWSRVGLVAFMTAAVLVSYVVLAIDAPRRFADVDLAVQHTVFVASTVVMGLLVGHQVRRARNLSRLMARQLRAR